MIHTVHKLAIYGCAIGLAGLFASFTPTSAFAERPEVDCGKLSETDSQTFYDLSAQCANAASEKKYEEAISLCQKAMSMCTTDAYTEYTLGKLFLLTEDYAKACYHFEILNARPASVQKENADVYKELKKSVKSLKNKCDDLYLLEVTCKTPDVNLSISGLSSMSNFKCPYYSKVPKGSYPITASKEGYRPRKETATVSNGQVSVVIPALVAIEHAGTLSVVCPRGASKFILTNSDGDMEQYLCPWEGEVPADTYKIRLGGTGPESDIEVVVSKKGRTEYRVPSAPKSSCSASPSGSPASHGVFIAASLALLGLAVTRRRQSR